MHGCDGRLQRVRPEAPRRKGSLHQRLSFGDLLPVPARAVLIVEQNQFACRRSAGGTP
jgi:hypothetical protein